MRIRIFIDSLCVFACLYFISTTAYSSPHADLVYRIKPNPTAGSKPAFLKLASVSFLEPDSNLNFKSKDFTDTKMQCAAAGYAIGVSQCTTLNKNSGILCPYNASYTSHCCDKSYNQSANASCGNNAILSEDFCTRGTSDMGNGVTKYYKCTCPETAYPYTKDSDCPAGYQLDHTPARKCTANGETRYSTCMPKSYKDCSKEGVVNGSVGGLIGVMNGGSGMLENGTMVYESCICPSQYTYADCDTFLINPNESCKANGHEYYKAGNCYSGCSDSGTTDADYYYERSALRCLFDPNAQESYTSLIKINTDINKSLCTRVINSSEETSAQTCAEMGYLYSADECPSGAFIAHCPSNTNEVWCMDANACMHSPVGGAACNKGAKITTCVSDSTRCKYQSDICNQNWASGTHHDTYGGDTASCCKEGFEYIGGKCTPRVCSSYDYPYGDQYPYVGAARDERDGIQSCTTGSLTTGETTTVYGYKSGQCDTTLWKADTNPHRCICKTDGLPYDNSTLYTQGGSGNYGKMKTCVDTEATYYGYSTCYRWTYSNTATPGTCSTYPSFFTTNGYGGAYPIDDLLLDEGDVLSDKCTAAEEEACKLNDELCHKCTNATVSYIQNVYFGQFSRHQYNYLSCPKVRPYPAGTDTFRVCYNKCDWGSADCRIDDVVYKNGKAIGIIWEISGKTVRIFALEVGKNVTWDEHNDYIKNFAPSGFESDTQIGKGKWSCGAVNWGDRSFDGNYRARPNKLSYIAQAVGYTIPTSYYWRDDGVTETSANCVDNSANTKTSRAKNNKYNALPMITFTKP